MESTGFNSPKGKVGCILKIYYQKKSKVCFGRIITSLVVACFFNGFKSLQMYRFNIPLHKSYKLHHNAAFDLSALCLFST